MNLTLEKAPESNFKLFPVAEELVPEGIKTITYNDQIFTIVDKYTFHKKEFFPTGFMNFVFGKEIEPRAIWNKYQKSEKLIIFICKPQENEKKVSEEKPTEAKETAIPKIFSK